MPERNNVKDFCCTIYSDSDESMYLSGYVKRTLTDMSISFVARQKSKYFILIQSCETLILFLK